MTNLSVRLLKEEDIPFIVNYWYEKNDADFIRMGADKSKFPAREVYSESLKEICNIPLEKRTACYIIWLFGDEPIGYAALKEIRKSEVANMNLHMWSVQHRGKGFGPTLFCLSALQFYRLFGLKLILCEPKATNSMPNRMLTKIGFEKWKTYLGTSSEISQVCELNSYIINSNIAESFLRGY